MHKAIRPIYSKDITRSGQRQRYLWNQYSERCATITAMNFETVYYFAFHKRNEAQAFAQRIAGRHCNDVAVRASKRFTQGQYDWEVKVWGMSESAFFTFVRRDRSAHPPKVSDISPVDYINAELSLLAG
jgi:phage terminase large subunit GpA-like protein